MVDSQRSTGASIPLRSLRLSKNTICYKIRQISDLFVLCLCTSGILYHFFCF